MASAAGRWKSMLGRRMDREAEMPGDLPRHDFRRKGR
jgi:hypothetical protein